MLSFTADKIQNLSKHLNLLEHVASNYNDLDKIIIIYHKVTKSMITVTYKQNYHLNRCIALNKSGKLKIVSSSYNALIF